MKRLLALSLFGILFAAHEVRAVAPCCAVTAIDVRSGVVTARESATGRTFQFKLDDTALARSVKVGQIVEADFKTMKATVRPAGGAVCCAITALSAGNVTVRDNATGRTSQITVRDAALLGTLKVGQTVDANASTGSIAVAPTGSIVK
jgi:Cu/Ag efflux protein CusF